MLEDIVNCGFLVFAFAGRGGQENLNAFLQLFMDPEDAKFLKHREQKERIAAEWMGLE